ncbi:MAG: hypothetical protein ACE5RJ_05645, partial [Nitrosopumilaceae archaeon]
MSISESEPLELFLYAMKSDATKSRYKRRLRNFFDYLELKGDLSEQAKQFIANTKKNGNTWASAKLMKFLSYQRERVDRNEIAVGTLRNYYKPTKLFLEMNEIELPWKKIGRGILPEYEKLLEVSTSLSNKRALLSTRLKLYGDDPTIIKKLEEINELSTTYKILIKNLVIAKDIHHFLNTLDEINKVDESLGLKLKEFQEQLVKI